jgi:3-phenylpropionate/trans-cinnamate dioxygenase ferredoxin reductase subunit
VKLQIAGLSQGYDQTVLRGDPESGRFALYYFAQGRLLAVDAVNSPKDFMTCKRWLAEHKRLDIGRLADPAVALTSV